MDSQLWILALLPAIFAVLITTLLMCGGSGSRKNAAPASTSSQQQKSTADTRDTTSPSTCCTPRNSTPRSRRPKMMTSSSMSSDGSTCELEGYPVPSCMDAGDEAKQRHETLDWFPKLELMKKSIIVRNFEQFKGEKFSHPDRKTTVFIGPDAQKERLDKLKAKYAEKHVSFDQHCPVYVVYGFDQCRGELRYDDRTMDDVSENQAGELEKQINKVTAHLVPTHPGAATPKSHSPHRAVS